MVEKQLLEENQDGEELSYHVFSVAESLDRLKTSQDIGLDEEEVGLRQEQYGPNQLAEKPRPTLFMMLVAQINNFLIILLIVAAVVSFLLGDTIEAAAIMAIVVLNAVLGVVQEGRAEQALAALKKLAAPEAQVLRSGRRVNVPANELVPGDIVFLEAGNFVPADLRLLEAVNLRIDEAALTGESVAVEKYANMELEKDIPLGDMRNISFMGTTVTYGRGQGVVVGTGMKTQLGLIAGMLQSVEEGDTPLQQRLESLGKVLGWGSLAIVFLVFLIGLVRIVGNGGGFAEIKDSFMIAVSLAIAAVPEGLPAVVTISLAMGMREMVRRHALIRRLASVETLGSATVICSDKTGTLTQNEMTVTTIWSDGVTINVSGSGYTSKGEFLVDGKKFELKKYSPALSPLWVGCLNNDCDLELINQDNGVESYRLIGDPTEGSILVAASKLRITTDMLEASFPRRAEIPFDSSRKRMVTIHEVKSLPDGEVLPLVNIVDPVVVAVKGAPDIVLGKCSSYISADGTVKPIDEVIREKIWKANERMTDGALRVLGMAYRTLSKMPDEIDADEIEADLVFSGLVGMIDPPRMEVQPALELARKAGIRTIMITGDYPNTAKAIASEIGLLQESHHVITGNQLNELSDESLKEEVIETDVFARVSPEHKMRIVDALIANDQVVAMTGDGVNDAPAIKRADIGIAMGITGTDVAKETADMVLTDDNYASIVSAIEQGRVIYSNIRKFVYYLLSCNLAEIAIIFLATVFGWPPPLSALQLLWLNLLTDGAPALALATEKGDPDIMEQAPRPTKEPIINRNMLSGIVVQTIAITTVTLVAYFIGLADPVHTAYAQTMAFVTLSSSELFRAYTARSEYYPLFKIGLFSNKWMNCAVIFSLVLILVVVYVPFLQTIFGTEGLGLTQWIEIIPLLLLPSVAAEVTKYILSKKVKKASSN